MEGIIQEAVLPHVGVMTFFLLTGVIINWIAYLGGFYKLPYDDDPFFSDHSSLSFLKLLGVFAVFLGINAVITVLVRVYLLINKGIPIFKDIAIDEVLGPTFLGWMDLLFIFCSVASILFYSYLWGPSMWDALAGKNGLSSVQRSLRDFGMGVLALVICYPLVNFFNEILEVVFEIFHIPPIEQVPVEKIVAIRDNPSLFLVTSLSVLFLVPFAEEILFRGYLQTWIKQKLGRFSGIVLTSLIFAFFHYADKQGIRNVQFIGTLFVLSCFLGYVKERQQSIWAPFGLHAAFNSIALAAIYFKV
ncbi:MULTISPECIES: CPBP family intramembrane glutamic endopeptidase [Parachlamydia]|uniref:CAAX prenyl protease 2/Lysostaphin resistance protein A-like domain-containing protein n=2 Tax=Parachlamydia acanthamoebae TaxID=83552 RepID=F8KZQ3_PARAV|nr:type II CAAX endopeptidase family protein [Parachlamydia acanthamoebae]KIA77862.1 hypothetical protein DB43_FM00140 [Parachlamydia acanthamoebae]CCB86405.1 putative uncharacterized protein [Parachlamydia acanthamoebae UV-7]